MGHRLNWERANDRDRLREVRRKSLYVERKLFTEVWERAETVEEAAEVLGIEPKHVFWLRKLHGLSFKPGNQPSREATGKAPTTARPTVNPDYRTKNRRDGGLTSRPAKGGDTP